MKRRHSLSSHAPKEERAAFPRPEVCLTKREAVAQGSVEEEQGMDMTGTAEGRRESHRTKRLRIMHIVNSGFGRNFSGQTHYLFSLLSGWKDEDVVLDIWGSSVRPLNIGSGSTDYKLASQLWSPGRKSSSGMDKLRGYIRQFLFLATHARSFDMAHFHSPGWGSLLSPLLLHLLGKKAVFTSSLYGSDNPTAVKAAKRGRLAVRFLRGFDGIVALSPLLAEDFRAFGSKNVACLPNFLALPSLERGRDAGVREKLRTELGIPLDAVVLLFVGAVIKRKGIDLLAESFARLAQGHSDLWLIAVGPNGRKEVTHHEEELVRAVNDRLDTACASRRVIWTGTVRDKNALVQYYSAADVFVLPTRAEGLANVLIEASAAGLPIVATDLPGITDVPVADGETGFLVPVDDVDGLTQAIERLVTDSTLRTKMGQAARIRSKQFGFEDYHRGLKTFYRKVAGLSL